MSTGLLSIAFVSLVFIGSLASGLMLRTNKFTRIDIGCVVVAIACLLGCAAILAAVRAH